MQELIDKIRNELRSAWRFRRYALAVAWGVCLVGWLVVYAIPDRYESRARVNVDTRTALKPLLEGLAVNQDVEAQLNMVRQALLGRAKLEQVAQQVGMDFTAKTPQERDKILTSLSGRIEIALEPPAIRDPRIPNTFYRITFTDPNQQTALQVVDVLLNSFVEGTMGSERSGTASAQRFLRDQLTQYDRDLAEAEQRLAEFKKKNVGMVPGEEGGYFQRLQFEMQEVKRLSSAIAIANSKRDELQRQLRGETPFTASDSMTTQRGANGQQGGPQDTASRIQETQARLDDMLLRYTDKHPEVIAARETLGQLRTRQKEELAALKRGDAGAAAVAGAFSNPIYQNIQLQLNQVEVELATLRQQLADHKRNEAELRRVVDTVPEVEAEYARLTRDYDVTKAQYNALLERSERAKLSSAADKTGIVAFDIVDPPVVSFQPVFPNRPLFLAAVLALGLGAGGAVAYLMHLMKPVFSDTRSLGELTGLPVIGSVTRTWLEKQRAELRMGLLRYSAMSALLLGLFIVAVLVQGPAARLMRQVLG